MVFDKLVPERSVFVKLTPIKLIFDKSKFVKLEFDKLAYWKLHVLKLCFDVIPWKSLFVRFVFSKLQLYTLEPVNVTFDKFAFVKSVFDIHTLFIFTFWRLAPERLVPEPNTLSFKFTLVRSAFCKLVPCNIAFVRFVFCKIVFSIMVFDKLVPERSVLDKSAEWKLVPSLITILCRFEFERIDCVKSAFLKST